MHLKFQSPFDSAAYQLAKAKGKEAKEKGASDEKTASSTKPIHTKRDTTSGTVTMTVGKEFPPTQTLPPMEVYDLTAEEESLVRLPKSTRQQATQEQATQEQVTQEKVTQEQATQQQATQEQATQETEDGNDQGRETFTHSAEHSKEDLTQQSRSPKDGGRLANGAGTVQHSSRDDGQESVGSDSAHGPTSSAQSPNSAAGLPTDAASNAVPTCWESGGSQAAGVSRCSNAPSPGTLELEPNKPSNLRGQAADSYESASSDGGVCPELSMDDGEGDSILSDEWEGKIIGEEADKYLVAWENSFIPKGYASAAMIQTWEGKKAKILAGEGKRGVGSELKQPATIKGRVEKRGTRKRGRGRRSV